jgi:hypothetical protein
MIIQRRKSVTDSYLGWKEEVGGRVQCTHAGGQSRGQAESQVAQTQKDAGSQVQEQPNHLHILLPHGFHEHQVILLELIADPFT